MNSRSFVKFGARQCLRGLHRFRRGPALWTEHLPSACEGGRFYSRNVAAACASGDEESQEGGGNKKGKGLEPPKGFGASLRGLGQSDPDDEVSNTEALLQTLGEVSQSSGRDPKSHLVLSDDTSAAGWKEIDDKVNKYPIERNFQAIGTGGEDFTLAMVAAVESILGVTIPETKVKTKKSSGGKYNSVNIGPLTVNTSEQLTAIYQAMATDTRLKWWM